MDKIDDQSLNDFQFPFREYVLALPGWYPTWQDPYPGDFNQRHILAAGQFIPQVVLYISKDLSGLLRHTEVRCRQLSEKVVEIVVVYPAAKLFNPIQSNVTYIYLLQRFTKMVLLRFGKPLLIHSYIVVRGGLAGRWLAEQWKVPLVLTENWTIFYPEDPGYIKKRNVFFRRAVKWTFNGVSLFLPVTKSLQQQVARLRGPMPSVVVPNVVDTTTFFPARGNYSPVFTFIHVSTMSYQKNPHGLLRAFHKFLVIYPHVRLVMVGPTGSEVMQYAASLEFLPGVLEFSGAVSYTEVAGLLKNSNCLVLFSRYENLPCVVLEALCCGLPVISTDVGGIREVVDDRNGLLLANEDEAALLQAYIRIFETYGKFDRRAIAERAKLLFSYETVGKQMYDLYAGLLTKEK